MQFAIKIRLLFLLCLLHTTVYAQTGSNSSNVYVDGKGIMRWPGTGKEVKGFGINYTVPFAYAYRIAKRMGIEVEKTIDADVYHFARLGFDAFRVHVWDTEISDTLGNLIANDHLRLFDYMLWKMKQRGMYFLITPIAYWGNGWPEPDEKTPGFSARYGKEKCLTDTNAIKAQERYLNQFLNHVNRYTGIAYKNEPNIVAFEISNEPHHAETADKVTAFIQRMMAAIKSTGCGKPVFYNISHSIHLKQAYFNAAINGGTFQWYPTGLGFKQELKGNLLPNVDDYRIPFANDEAFKKIAKVVYEFDAADVGRSYIYPAIARSFRTAGIQWATHFAYDPTFVAYANTEYDTHFMNLVYAPQKALSLMIAGEVFHRIPVYKSFGMYPADTSFDGFRVSYQSDLAEMVTEEKFIYTNNTTTVPLTSKLTLIAGYGNSPLVKYNGAGAYFLDKIREGIWRLEIMPDAVWINDPFGKNSLKKTNVVINWRKNKLQLQLPDLAKGFKVTGLNTNNSNYDTAVNGVVLLSPGTYLVQAKNALQMEVATSKFNDRFSLNEFTAPATTVTKTYVVHQPAYEIQEENPLEINAVVVGQALPKAVQLYVLSGHRPQSIFMDEISAYHYTATVPAAMVRSGYLKYVIAVTQNNDSVFTFPGGLNTAPGNADYYSNNAWSTTVVPAGSAIYLFNAFDDAVNTVRPWLTQTAIVPGRQPNVASLSLNIEKLAQHDTENKDDVAVSDYTMRFYFREKITGRLNDVLNKSKLILKANALNGSGCPVQVALLTTDGLAYGAIINLDTLYGEYTLPLSALTEVETILLPRPYPSFLPYYFNHGPLNFDIRKIEALQISIGPGLAADSLSAKHGISIESVRLE